MSFTISTTGITQAPIAAAMPSSAQPITSKPNAPAIGGIAQTANVAASEPSAASHKVTFCFFMVNKLPLCERMFKLWKISASDIVKNAIVVPCELSVICQLPVSIKCPIK